MFKESREGDRTANEQMNLQGSSIPTFKKVQEKPFYFYPKSPTYVNETIVGLVKSIEHFAVMDNELDFDVKKDGKQWRENSSLFEWEAPSIIFRNLDTHCYCL